MDYNALGTLALNKGDYQEAVNIFLRSIEQKKSAAAYTGLGQACRHLRDYPMARWAFYKALDLQPTYADAVKQLAALETVATAPPLAAKSRYSFRAGRRHLEVHDGSWRPLFVKGINLGVGLPGFFPGEFPVKETTYLNWFRQMTGLGFNTLRTYTVHPPAFYEAFARFNSAEGPLFLLQGIWTELPDDNDFSAKRYLTYIHRQITTAVDAVHGNAELPEEPGNAHGRYRADASPWTAGFIFGREWEQCAVKAYNAMHGTSQTSFHGEYLEIDDALPFEAWVTARCDFIQHYEESGYRTSRPVSTVNWPTLDPLTHPSESDHEEELARQGIFVSREVCNENEDMVTLDTAKIRARSAGGFFATYHVYPYYPDFLNNDYPEADDPYHAYLTALKRHHGSQAVIIGEFGVPSSREVTHWQKNGWHHGGHDELQQGEINARLMRTIHDTDMAGGVLFAWFDEWFKRNWLFLPFELPADRKPFWFSSQDAEENYGLLAAYPGYPDKKVTLANRREEWKGATVLAEKSAGEGMIHRFGDGHDEPRHLQRLLIQHDEGFLYLRLETSGTIDFTRATYLIALDTCSPEHGEFQLPLGTRLRTPIGFKFLIHLAGERTSRILTCQAYDRYLNKERGIIHPGYADQGEWVLMMNRTNFRRISKDGGRFFPARTASMSHLRCGSLDRSRSDYTSQADFHVGETAIELRIPWGLINVTDPSSRQVLWFDGKGKTRTTDGIRALAVSFKPAPDAPMAVATGGTTNITDALPASLRRGDFATYGWQTWHTPMYHTYLKAGVEHYRKLLASLSTGATP